jgi:hypothetical protein
VASKLTRHTRIKMNEDEAGISDAFLAPLVPMVLIGRILSLILPAVVLNGSMVIDACRESTVAVVGDSNSAATLPSVSTPRWLLVAHCELLPQNNLAAILVVFRTWDVDTN